MAREVRITVDDDEVFERMKARKRELDLSWEEVLHRGLRQDVGGRGEAEPGRYAERGPRGTQPGVTETRDPARRSDDSIGDVVDEFKDQIRGQVRESLRTSMASMDEAATGLNAEMTELAEAEDAVLRFDAVADERRYDVPLRVRLETSRGSLDVDVVAVREGKSVGDANSFDRETRGAVNEHLARGGTATLAFAGGEAYEVAPVLTWSHEDGTPTVTAVDVAEVLFDDE